MVQPKRAGGGETLCVPVRAGRVDARYQQALSPSSSGDVADRPLAGGSVDDAKETVSPPGGEAASKLDAALTADIASVAKIDAGWRRFSSRLPNDRDGFRRGGAGYGGPLDRLRRPRRDRLWAFARRGAERQNDDLRRNSRQRTAGRYRSRRERREIPRPTTRRRCTASRAISRCRFFSGGSFFGTLCAIDPRPAKLNRPEIIGMFKNFAQLIAFHLEAAGARRATGCCASRRAPDRRTARAVHCRSRPRSSQSSGFDRSRNEAAAAAEFR